MPTASFHFPKGFLWGAATAAHQVEGNNNNNQWWTWEQQEGRIANGEKSGLACDWLGGAGRRISTAPPRADRTPTACRSSGAASNPRPTAGMKMPWSIIAKCCADCASAM
jgi:hypothetical protein